MNGNVYLVFRDKILSQDSGRFVPYLFEFAKPAEYLAKEHGAKISYQKEFFSSICHTLTKDDVVVLFISCKEEDNIKKLSECKARKILRVVDPSKSDMVLYKNPLLLHEKVGFEAFAICYPNKDHINFLEEKGLRVIVWPHSLDFTLSKESFSKKYMWISAGQQHEEYYPSRWNLTQILYHQFKENGFILPHPGYDVDNLGHPYVGEKFLELLDDFIFIPIGIGINDGLHMKFVEAAYSNMLPIGTVPSYIPDHIKDLIPFSRMDPLNYDVGLIINTLNDLASTSQELVRRVLAYKEYFKQNYDSKIVLDRVAEEIIE